jgi:hypothetical protein
MFVDDGVTASRYMGIQFDGRGKAAIGFNHQSFNRFETEVRHHHLAFRNLTKAGIYVDPKDKYALAEAEINNCLFENCGMGVSFTSFNDYDFTFDGCEFRQCGIAIECYHGNFYARNTHFEGSKDVDIHCAPEHASSVRRCTSVGSKAFIRQRIAVTPLVIQDCQVAGWTNPQGAVDLDGGPVVMFDCTFRDGPDGQAPVMIRRAGLPLVVSENRAVGAPELIRSGHKGTVYTVGAGTRAASLTSAQQRFLKDTAVVPGRVFDVKTDFGAKGDGKTDDTAAIQQAIDAAREHGKGAIAYLPSGRYIVTKTLQITGSDYVVGGTGFNAALTWRGETGGTMIAVVDPENVTLEHLAVGNHDAGKMDNAIDILQTGSGKPSRMTYDGVFVYGMYQKDPFRKGLYFRNLGKEAVVVIPHVQGNLRFIDSSDATFLVPCSYEGSVIVEGKSPARGGVIAFLTRLSTITTHGLYLRDNQSITMTDFYVEQAMDGFVLEGEPGLPPGRATIQGAKVDFTHGGKAQDGTVLDIRNYRGEVFFGPDQFYASLPRVPVVQKGDQPVDVFLWANCFYKTHLEVVKEAGLRLHLVANSGVKIDGKDTVLTHENRAVDNLPADQLDRLIPALDDLRRAGALDLRINHPAILD